MRPRLTLALVLVWAGAPLLAGAPAPEGEWAVAVFPSGTEFSLEIAADPHSRALGYMFRERVGPGEGMLFLFETADRHSIWMKNCRVSLDLIWLDADFRVVEIAAEQPPCPEEGPCPSIVPMKPGRYVLEIAGGTAAREGLRPGDRLVVLGGPGSP
jgi:uncharacterized membrane protein (UPF0127 family)